MNLTFRNGAGGRKDEKKKRGVDENITQVLLFPKKKEEGASSRALQSVVCKSFCQCFDILSCFAFIFP